MSSYLVESLQRYVRCVCVLCLNEECVRSCAKSNGKFLDLLCDATCLDIFLPVLFYSNIVT